MKKENIEGHIVANRHIVTHSLKKENIERHIVAQRNIGTHRKSQCSKCYIKPRSGDSILEMNGFMHCIKPRSGDSMVELNVPPEIILSRIVATVW